MGKLKSDRRRFKKKARMIPEMKSGISKKKVKYLKRILNRKQDDYQIKVSNETIANQWYI
jgi:hypothetical protein